MSTRIDEIADGIYRISTKSEVVPGGFTFNQFLIRDDEPLLFHTGLRNTFSAVKEAIGRVMPIEKLRYVSFSHVEADECGSMNLWLAAAPRATIAASGTACNIQLNDLCDRPPRALADNEVLDIRLMKKSVNAIAAKVKDEASYQVAHTLLKKQSLMELKK